MSSLHSSGANAGSSSSVNVARHYSRKRVSATMRLHHLAFTFSAAIGLWSSTVSAQNVTIQQPVIGQHSVNTSVIVPDRGTAFISGIGRAADSRNNYVPFRSGTSLGTERSHSGTTARVWIVDVREMDEEILADSEPPISRATKPALSPNASHAYRLLMNEHRRPAAAISSPLGMRPLRR